VTSRSFAVSGPRVGLGDAVRAALVPWALARVIVPSALGLARHLATELDATPRPLQLAQGLHAWDGAFYAAIARDGYEPLGREAYRFFPMFPLVGRALAWLPGVDERLALVLVASISALVAGALLVLLVDRETGNAAAARRAPWLLALAPPAAVLVMGYAEGLFLALALGALLAARSGRFAAAGLLGGVAALTRPVGVLLAVPAAVEAARGWTRAPLAGRASRVASVLGPAAGVLSYAWWVHGRTGDWWLAFRVQGDPSLRGDTVTPVESLVDAASALLHGDELGTGLHFVTAIAALVLLVVTARRLPASYTAYAAVSVGVVLTASSLNSLERYVLVTVPLLVAAALIVRGAAVERVVVTLSAVALFALSTLSFAGVHVP
jgi:hypothetical protein